MRHTFRFAKAILSMVLLAGCSGGDDTLPPVNLDEEAGYLEIEPISVSFSSELFAPPTTTPPARIFYAFQPADEAPQKRPLFVFFNGGPGFATSLGLFTTNIARRSLDPRHNGGGVVGPSPRPWTAMGNLLFIDPRQTGFSYDLGSGDDPSAREASFQAGVYNPFTDAADTIRVILRFLAAHEALQDQPVILVGESYGGTRATAMLYELQHADQIEGSGSLFRDDALAAEIRAHFAKIRPGEPFTPDLVASQFGKQVLVEPVVAGNRQMKAADAALGRPGSPLPEIAKQYGVSCSVCAPENTQCDPEEASRVCMDNLRMIQRDVGDLSLSNEEVTASMTAAEAALRTLSSLEEVLGVDPREIPGLAAAGRAGAYRFGADVPVSYPPPSDFDSIEPIAQDLGALPAHDRYFVGQNVAVTMASMGTNLDWTRELWGTVFLKVLERTDTFITSARYDGIVYTPALGDALATYEGVEGATLDRTPHAGVARPGWITVKMTPAGEPEPVTRVIRMPFYAAGHAVSEKQPVEFAEDVEAWLAGE